MAGDASPVGRDLTSPDFEAEDTDASSDQAGDVADATGDDADDASGSPDVPNDPLVDGSVEDDLSTSDLADSGGDDVNPGQLASLEFEIESEGGFTGWGHRDYQYADGLLVTHYPYLDPTDCSAELTTDEVADLYAAAAAVDWGDLAEAYLPPANPTCCCDQFFHLLSASVTYVNDDPATVDSQWCTQSLSEELLPPAFVTFLDTLAAIGDRVIGDCTGS